MSEEQKTRRAYIKIKPLAKLLDEKTVTQPLKESLAQVPITPDEMYRQTLELFTRMIKFLPRIELTLSKVEKIHCDMKRELSEIKKEVKRANAENKTLMLRVEKTNLMVEETACNILLAVRQNQFAQAWYPEPFKIPQQAVGE